MPVVVDDILVNFDDDRARAALRCLAALAAKRGSLLFPHHSHVLSLAEKVLTPGQFAIPELTL